MNLNPENLLRLKDETMLTDDAVKVWIDKLSGMTCGFGELKDHEKAVNEANDRAFGLHRTPDGYAVNFEWLDKLIQLANPWIQGPVWRGVNIDGTEMGGRKTTAASLRLLNDEIKEKIKKVNSAKETWFFAIMVRMRGTDVGKCVSE